MIIFTLWELIGHWFLMAVPMGVRHSLSILIGTTLALLIATVSIQAIWRQQKELQKLVRLRDYLLRMQAHYLRLSPESRTDPQQQLEYRTLELKYADIQQRLVSQRTETRASAIVDLWELARTHLPKMREPYPFFFCAISHLTAALYLETERSPREEALRALTEMAGFARNNEPRLLHPLIENMVHANRAALSALTDTLVERFTEEKPLTEDGIKSLLPLVRFTASEETDTAILHDLLDSAPCQESLSVQRVLLKAGKTPQSDDASLLNAIRVAAIGLRDTRDALAKVLCALSTPEDFPKEFVARRNWKRAQPLSLNACFLVGAELDKVQLQGVDLQHTSLQAATLTDAQLQNADLTGADLWKAQIFAAGLEYAKLWDANLRDASLPAAHLEGADMSRAHLQGAHLTGAYLKDACLWKIAIADDERKREHTTVFTDANWWEARFTDILSGSTDTEARTWLEQTFPQPVPEATSKAETVTR